MKKDTINECKQYGLVWNDFKIPYGAIYGRYNGTEFICTDIPHGSEQMIKVWLKGETWYKTRVFYAIEIQTVACQGNIQAAITRQEIFHRILEYALSHECVVKGFRPATCKFYSRQVTPKRRKVGKYTPTKECYSQRCVDGRGYAPAPYLFNNGNVNPHSESMVENYPVYNEPQYWTTFKR